MYGIAGGFHCLTVPAIVSVRLLSNIAKEWWARTVAVNARRDKVKHPIAGKGFMVELQLAHPNCSALI